MNQEQALDLLKMGKNVFLTGEAGSGKTYLLNKYIQYLKKNNVAVAITASTGIAATHLQGTTIHSWSGIGIKDVLTEDDLALFQKSKPMKRQYSKTKVLIIDEISMLHKHQLEMVDSIARCLLNPTQPFGGIQVVLCGDFFQLPPVSSGSFRLQRQFAFESDAWKSGDFNICYLNEQHRQVNDPLLTILKDIRSGTAGEHTKVPLRTRYKKEPEGSTKATKLYSRNMNVDAINERELANIPGEETVFTMVTTGFSSLVEGLKRSCLAPERLKLKVGAEVMFIKNDPQGRYVNGTRCVVIGFDKQANGWPIVRTYHNETIVAYPDDWKVDDDGIVRASISQVPLRLAWAITIHKSQGVTLDAAEIDLGDAFEPGMGYVALSRVRSLTGLKLMNLNEMALKVNAHILQQDEIFKAHSADAVKLLESLSENEMVERQTTTLVARFGGSETKMPPKKKPKLKKQKEVATHLVTLESIKENLLPYSIAEKRGLKIGTVLAHIEKLLGLKMINPDYFVQLKASIPQNEFDPIMAELKLSEDGRLNPIYEKFEGKYSFAKIKLIRMLMIAEENSLQVVG